MRASEFQFPIGAEHPLFVHRWSPDGSPVARLLVVHGMAEHGARYAGLAQALTDDGFEVIAPDLPGHGRSAGPDELGHIGDGKDWASTVEMLHALRAELDRGGAPLPWFVFGHSMGSFLVQDYLVEHGQGLAGAVLSGTTGSMGSLRRIGLVLLSLEAMLLGRRHRSALAEALTFKTYARRFSPRRTDFDWLSRDSQSVDRYVADPLCGFRCSTATWLALLRAGAGLVDPERLARIPSDLPVLMISGSGDPVSAGAAGPQILARAYRRIGMRQVDVRIYDDGRHELLHDLCREDVLRDLRRWLGNHRRTMRS